MTPSEFRIGTVPRTVTAVTSAALNYTRILSSNENYFGKILLDPVYMEWGTPV